MSKPFTNPFFEADMSKLSDMSKIFDMSKLTGDMHLPQFDIEAAFALQRKNIEAYTALNQAAYESFQSLWRRQTDTLRAMIEEASQTAQAIMSSPTPEDKALKQAEISKVTLEKCLANVRDISDTVSKCQTQAIDTVGARLNDGMNELRGIISKSSRSA
jgi:phasin family protein